MTTDAQSVFSCENTITSRAVTSPVRGCIFYSLVRAIISPGTKGTSVSALRLTTGSHARRAVQMSYLHKASKGATGVCNPDPSKRYHSTRRTHTRSLKKTVPRSRYGHRIRPSMSPGPSSCPFQRSSSNSH